MFDLEKFKTGEYFVHLPTEDIYRDAMEFLKRNGIGWLSRTEFLYESEICIRYANETDYGLVGRKGIVHSSENYYIAKGFKELPTTKDKDKIKEILKKENYSLHIGGDDYTDKLSYDGEVSTNKTEVNDLVKSPNHYIGIYGLEVEEVLRNFIPRYVDGYVAHRMASAIEYIIRSPLKNGTEDLEKAGYNIQQALEHIKKKEGK